MKVKLRILTSLCFFLSCFLFAIEEGNFSLLPNEFFVGDEVTGLYSFSSDDAHLALLTEKGAYTFSAPNLFISAGFDCDCTKIEIRKDSTDAKKNAYTASIIFYPYVIGPIDLPPFDLGELIAMSVSPNTEQLYKQDGTVFISPIHIDIPSFSVVPILSRYPSESLRPPKGPVIIPGTTYILYGIAALLLVCIGLFVYLFLAFEKIRKRLVFLYHSIFMSANLKRSLRELKKLQKKGFNLPPHEFSQKITNILRTFLEKRYYLPFSCTCTDELQTLFNERFQDTFTGEQQDAVHRLYELFLRCDFIRFSNVQKDDHTLGEDERKRLIQKALELLLFFEKGEKMYA